MFRPGVGDPNGIARIGDPLSKGKTPPFRTRRSSPIDKRSRGDELGIHQFGIAMAMRATPTRVSLATRGQKRWRCGSESSSQDAGRAVYTQEELDVRSAWYEPNVAANDQPAWRKAEWKQADRMHAKAKDLVLMVETSRELVARENAYTAVGQKARVKVAGGEVLLVPVATAPFPLDRQQAALFKLKGDMFAGEIKEAKEEINVVEELHLLVLEEEHPDLFRAEGDETIEVGPFHGNGIDLRNSLMHSVYRFKKVLLFAEGSGIATAKAFIEAPGDQALTIPMREEVKLYYKVPNQESVCYKHLFEEWESKHGVKTVLTTSSFQDAFDDDDELEYDPETTGIIILGDEDTCAEVYELMEDAEIPRTAAVSSMQEALKLQYLKATKMF